MDFHEAHGQWLQDPNYRREWKRLEPDHEISRVILRLRASKGWSQQDLARRLGVSQSYVAKLEAGRNITLRQLWRIARALDCTVELTLVPVDEEPIIPGEACRLPPLSVAQTWVLPPFSVKEVA